MSETDFRMAYDALMEQMPDPPSYERIRARTLEPVSRRVPGWQAAVIGAVTVLLSIGGVAWLTGGGGQSLEDGGDSEGSLGVEERMRDIIADLGGLCDQSSGEGDFDGDGLADLAVIGIAGCNTETDPQDLTLAVAWSTGATESWHLDRCGVAQPGGSVTRTGICQVFAVPDLNGDGRAELAVKVQQAAGSISLLQFYELSPGERSQAPVQIGPGGPGPGEITPGQVFVITFGSSSDSEHNLRCTTESDGPPMFLITVAESQGNEWSVFEGTWRFDGQLMSILSQRTYSVAKDAPEADDLIAGQSICGAPIIGP